MIFFVYFKKRYKFALFFNHCNNIFFDSCYFLG